MTGSEACELTDSEVQALSELEDPVAGLLFGALQQDTQDAQDLENQIRPLKEKADWHRRRAAASRKHLRLMLIGRGVGS